MQHLLEAASHFVEEKSAVIIVAWCATLALVTEKKEYFVVSKRVARNALIAMSALKLAVKFAIASTIATLGYPVDTL